jgi:hypothetical protein
MSLQRLILQKLRRLGLRCLGLLGMSALTGCGHVNVMGRNIPDSEHKAGYDAAIAREKNHMEPEGVHDEFGKIPSWDQYWCTIGGASATPPTAQSTRLRRYIIAKRRGLGLKELTCGTEYKSGDFNPKLYYTPGDPRIFQ